MSFQINNRKYKNQRGFSLLEIIIAVGLVAILGAIAIPSYQRQLKISRRGECKDMLVLIHGLEQAYVKTDHIDGPAAEDKYSFNRIYCPKTTGMNTINVSSSQGYPNSSGIRTKNVITLPDSIKDKYCAAQVGGNFPNFLTNPGNVAYQYRIRAARFDLFLTLYNRAVSSMASLNSTWLLRVGTAFPTFSSGSQNMYGYDNPGTGTYANSTAFSNMGLIHSRQKNHFSIECRGNIDEDVGVDAIYMDYNRKIGIYIDDMVAN